jgi:hypothetical protein
MAWDPSKTQTLPRILTPMAMLIALHDNVAAACVPVLEEAGLKVVRVRHATSRQRRSDSPC